MQPLNEMFSEELEAQMSEWAEKAAIFGNQYAEDKANYEEKEAVIRIAFAEIVSASEGKTNAEKERNALINPRFRSRIDEVSSLRRKMLLSQAKKENCVRWFDATRSLLSSKNTSKRTLI